MRAGKKNGISDIFEAILVEIVPEDRIEMDTQLYTFWGRSSSDWFRIWTVDE